MKSYFKVIPNRELRSIGERITVIVYQRNKRDIAYQQALGLLEAIEWEGRIVEYTSDGISTLHTGAPESMYRRVRSAGIEILAPNRHTFLTAGEPLWAAYAP